MSNRFKYSTSVLAFNQAHNIKAPTEFPEVKDIQAWFTSWEQSPGASNNQFTEKEASQFTHSSHPNDFLRSGAYHFWRITNCSDVMEEFHENLMILLEHRLPTTLWQYRKSKFQLDWLLMVEHMMGESGSDEVIEKFVNAMAALLKDFYGLLKSNGFLRSYTARSQVQKDLDTYVTVYSIAFRISFDGGKTFAPLVVDDDIRKKLAESLYKLTDTKNRSDTAKSAFGEFKSSIEQCNPTSNDFCFDDVFPEEFFRPESKSAQLFCIDPYNPSTEFDQDEMHRVVRPYRLFETSVCGDEVSTKALQSPKDEEWFKLFNLQAVGKDIDVPDHMAQESSNGPRKLRTRVCGSGAHQKDVEILLRKTEERHYDMESVPSVDDRLTKVKIFLQNMGLQNVQNTDIDGKAAAVIEVPAQELKITFFGLAATLRIEGSEPAVYLILQKFRNFPFREIEARSKKNTAGTLSSTPQLANGVYRSQEGASSTPILMNGTTSGASSDKPKVNGAQESTNALPKPQASVDSASTAMTKLSLNRERGRIIVDFPTQDMILKQTPEERKSLLTVKKDEIVYILKVTGDWLRCENMKGETGFISKHFVGML